VSSLTVLDIKTRVKRKFGDEAGVQLTDADIVRMINDAQRNIVARNDSLLEKSATADTTSGTQEYSFPSDLLKFKSLSYKGIGDIAYRPMKGMTLNELNMYVDSWDGNTSTLAVPIVYAIHAAKFQVYPVPSDSVIAAFKIYYNRAPVDVSLDTDIPDLPSIYHSIVMDFVLQDAYEMDEDWNAASAKSAQTNQNMDRAKSDSEWTRREFYPTISVRPEDF